MQVKHKSNGAVIILLQIVILSAVEGPRVSERQCRRSGNPCRTLTRPGGFLAESIFVPNR